MKTYTLFSVLLTSAILLGGVVPGQAQTQARKKERMKVREEVNMHHEMRKGVRESKDYESNYKDTHLNTKTYDYRGGQNGRKSVSPDDKPKLNRGKKIRKGIKTKTAMFRRAR